MTPTDGARACSCDGVFGHLHVGDDVCEWRDGEDFCLCLNPPDAATHPSRGEGRDDGE